jgi:hypothetical protein
MSIRSSKESLKSRNLSFLGPDRVDNLLKAHMVTEKGKAFVDAQTAGAVARRLARPRREMPKYAAG